MGAFRIILALVAVALFLAGTVITVESGFRIAGGGGGTVSYANLVGYVTNQSRGAGIVGASVKLAVSGVQKYATTTGTAGYYSFLAIPTGGYQVVVSAAGYSTFGGSVTLGSTQATWVYDVQLAAPGGTGGTAQGCTDVFTCSVPPPPPGTSPPPPPPAPTNATTNGTVIKTTYTPPLEAIVLFVFGAIVAVVAIVSKGS